jgi:hypothetical protein
MPHASVLSELTSLMGARTHTPRQCQLPHGGILPRTEELLALVVCPEAAHGVQHLAQPCPADPVEQPAHARAGGVVGVLGGMQCLLDTLDHALVARGL